jgi:ketosteroid isomerase-like protein
MSRRAVEQALADFLEAFDHLHWERFRACFADEATVYFPFGDTPRLARGRAQVEVRFERFFAELRAKGSGPRYLGLEPLDTEVRLRGRTALVTFHLALPAGVGRRTIAFGRDAEGWKIVHLHASNMPG